MGINTRKYKTEEYNICPYCKREIKKETLEKHLRKHNKQTPVTREKKRIAWYGRDLGYDDFSDITSYIHKSLGGFDNKHSFSALTTDANLLIDLLDELEKKLPEFQTPPSFPEYFSWEKNEIKQILYINKARINQILWDEINDKMYSRYRKVKIEYYKIYEEILSLVEKIEAKRKQLILLKESIKRNSSNGILFFELDWEIIPPGHNILQELKKYYLQFSIERKKVVDMSRLEKICSLKPNRAYKGKNNFEGYSVFIIKKYKEIICECPIIGNATYLLKGDWKELSKLKKRTLLTQKGNLVQRIVHQGEWFNNLKSSLSLKRPKIIIRKNPR